MTGIQWTDETWNPVVGCTPVSPGCLNCYAAVCVTLDLPDTKIVQPKGHWRTKATPIRAQREAACLLARSQAPPEPWQRAVIEYRIYYPNRRRRDVVNTMHGCKGAVDGLVDAGVVVDDSWAHLRVAAPVVGIDAANPRVELWVTEDVGATR